MTSPRIVVLTTYYHPVLGGVETHARQLAQCLSRRRLHVTIVTKRTDHSSPRRDHVDGIPVYRFRPLGPRTPSAKWLFLPSAFWALLRLRRRFDVIYCPDPRALGIAAVLAGKLLRRPVVVAAATPGALSCANWDQTLVRWRIASGGRLAAAIKWSARRLYAAADRFVCISRQIEQEARSCGIAQHRLVYLPYFVDLTRFREACPDEVARTRVELGWRSDQLVCLFIGRLSQEKAVLELLHAWRDLNPRAAILAAVQAGVINALAATGCSERSSPPLRPTHDGAGVRRLGFSDRSQQADGHERSWRARRRGPDTPGSLRSRRHLPR